MSGATSVGIIVVAAVVANFYLLQRPLADILGSYPVAGTPANVVAAAAIIGLELFIGFMAMEFWGLTNVLIRPEFPEAGKKIGLAITTSLLLFLAAIEVGLAVWRDVLITESAALQSQVLGETMTQEPSSDSQGGISWDTLIQGGLGFILPIVIAFVAVPLEGAIIAAGPLVRTLVGTLFILLSIPLVLIGKVGRLARDLVLAVFAIVVAVPKKIGEALNWFRKVFDR